VHEAYLRLVGDNHSQPSWDNRGHFFAAAAEAMRRILIEQARRKQSDKRGGDRQRIDIEQIDVVGKPDHEEMLAFDDALTKFSAEDPRIVKRNSPPIPVHLLVLLSDRARSQRLKGPYNLDLVTSRTKCFKVGVAFARNGCNRFAPVNRVMYLNSSSSGFGDD
jgi:hypothetical protein